MRRSHVLLTPVSRAHCVADFHGDVVNLSKTIVEEAGLVVAVRGLLDLPLCTSQMVPCVSNLGMLILCGLLSHQAVGKVCTCYLSLCSIFLSHILFVTPGLVLPLFHFQFLLLGLPSIARGTCLLH